MKTLVQMLFLVLMSAAFYDEDLAGDWNGTLNVPGAQLRLVFHVTKTDNGYKTSMDSPDQNVSGIPVTTTDFTYPNVKFQISNLGVVYEGTLSNNRITGKWMQSGQTFPLVLSKTEALPKETKQP
jgi:uncharacterized protein